MTMKIKTQINIIIVSMIFLFGVSIYLPIRQEIKNNKIDHIRAAERYLRINLYDIIGYEKFRTVPGKENIQKIMYEIEMVLIRDFTASELKDNLYYAGVNRMDNFNKQVKMILANPKYNVEKDN